MFDVSVGKSTLENSLHFLKIRKSHPQMQCSRMVKLTRVSGDTESVLTEA